MLVNMTEILEEAEKNKSAIACINTPNMETLKGLILAAEELNTPIIIDHAEVHNSIIPVETIGPYMVEAAKKAKVPVCVHVDHGRDMKFIMKCIQLGFTSVMYDRSDLPFEDNLEELKRFVPWAHAAGITVEAEFDIIPSGEEDTHEGELVSPQDFSKYVTDPKQAARFAEETGVDAIAILIGTAHGFYKEEPKLDVDIVKEARKLVRNDTRLVLHGASGVPNNQIQKAIDAGISKINYYSYLSTAVPPKLAEYINASEERIFYHDLALLAQEYIKELGKETMRVFMNN